MLNSRIGRRIEGTHINAIDNTADLTANKRQQALLAFRHTQGF